MSDFKVIRKLLNLIDFQQDNLVIEEISSGINKVFLVKNNKKAIVVKKYNQFWLDSSVAVLHNINYGAVYSRACLAAGVNCVIGYFLEPICLDNSHWQVFDYLAKDDFLFNYSAVIGVAEAMFDIEIAMQHMPYQWLELSKAEQSLCDQLDDLLLGFVGRDHIWQPEGLAHRDLSSSNLICFEKNVSIIDFDFSGPRSRATNWLAIALDLGYLQPPELLIKKYDLQYLKSHALPALIYEWRCWYNQLAYLADLCDLAKLEWEKQQVLAKAAVHQLHCWFGYEA